MQKTTWVVALVTAVVFAAAGYWVGSKSGKVAIAIATPARAHGSQDCRGHGTCKIDINVDNCDPAHPNPSTCEVFAVQELTLIGSDNTNLDFDIATHGFTFNQTDGIAFTTLNNGNQYFAPCGPQGQHYNCKVHVPQGNAGPFKYTIHVQNLNVVDPWVVNY